MPGLKGSWLLAEKIYWQDRDIEYPPTKEVLDNVRILIPRINDLIKDLPDEIRPTGISSGYRPGRHNVAAGGAPRSGHLTGKAVDLVDPGNRIDTYLDKHPELLVKHNLWREDPKRTDSWVHLDITVRKNRTFMV